MLNTSQINIKAYKNCCFAILDFMINVCTNYNTVTSLIAN